MAIIALGILLAIILILFSPVFSAIFLAILQLFGIIGNKSPPPTFVPPPSLAGEIASGPDNSASGSTGRASSISDRIRLGREISFNIDEVRGTVVAALEFPDGRTRILVHLEPSPEGDLSSFPPERVASIFKDQFCGSSGTLQELNRDLSKTELVVLTPAQSADGAGTARLCSNSK